MFENYDLDNLQIEKGDFVYITFSGGNELHGIVIQNKKEEGEWHILKCISSGDFCFTGKPKVIYVKNYQQMSLIQKRDDIEVRAKYDPEWFERLIGIKDV